MRIRQHVNPLGLHYEKFRGKRPPLDPAREVEVEIGCAEAQFLFETVGEDELIDPTLTPETLLYRLFHEQGVRVFSPTPLADVCRCSADRIDTMLQNFSAEERKAMVGDDGMIGVTCEFCSVKRIFDPRDYAA